MPELHPKRPRRAMYRESRTVVHYGNRLGSRAGAQLVDQFGNEWLELIKLNQDGVVRDFRSRQFDRVRGLKQQARFGLVITFLYDGHRANQTIDRAQVTTLRKR